MGIRRPDGVDVYRPSARRPVLSRCTVMEKIKHPSAIKRSPLFTHLAGLLCHHFSHYKLCYLVNVCCDTQGMAAGVGAGAGGRGMYDIT